MLKTLADVALDAAKTAGASYADVRFTRTLTKEVSVGLTADFNLAVQNIFAYQTLTMAPGATLTFQNGVAATDDPLAVVYTFAYKDAAVVGDQVLAEVTATVIPGLTLSIQPVAPDSAKLAAGSLKAIVPILQNPITGVGVSNPAMMYRVKGADSLRMDVYRAPLFITGSGGGQDFFRVRYGNTENGLFFTPNQIYGIASEGTAWVYALVNAYGTVLQDSVQYTLTYPYTMTISVVKANLEVASIFTGQIVTLASGAVVSLRNGVAATDPMTVTYTFDTPAAALAASPPSTTGGASGNVTTLIGGQGANRLFVTRGTYHWTAAAAGGPAPWPGQTVSGTLVIK